MRKKKKKEKSRLRVTDYMPNAAANPTGLISIKIERKKSLGF